jgi:pSer/pThr/pTyr-binding forkhead associated (FHA) protein
MAASLVPAEGGSPIALDKPIMLIGRNQECDIALRESSKISRRHCCIVQCGDRYLLRDLGSMNGVRVNAQRVVESELKPGDEVSVADVSFTFRVDDAKVNQGGRLLPQNLPVDPASEGSPIATVQGDQYPVVLPDETGDEPLVPPFHAEQDPQNEVGLPDDSRSEHRACEAGSVS